MREQRHSLHEDGAERGRGEEAGLNFTLFGGSVSSC